MNANRRELLKLAHTAYDTLLDEAIASEGGGEPDEETCRMRADAALKRLYKQLKELFERKPGG